MAPREHERRWSTFEKGERGINTFIVLRVSTKRLSLQVVVCLRVARDSAWLSVNAVIRSLKIFREMGIPSFQFRHVLSMLGFEIGHALCVFCADSGTALLVLSSYVGEPLYVMSLQGRCLSLASKIYCSNSLCVSSGYSAARVLSVIAALQRRT
jgi:hypothetical protein